MSDAHIEKGHEKKAELQSCCIRKPCSKRDRGQWNAALHCEEGQVGVLSAASARLG